MFIEGGTLPAFFFWAANCTKMRSMLGRIADHVVSIVYPQACHVCGGPVEHHEGGVACADCWSATRVFDGTETLCGKCGAHSGNGSPATSFCPQCVDDRYDRAIAVGVYEKALAATIVHLKKTPYICRRARRSLEDLADSLAGSDQIVIPVPLSKRRMLERGHNQADVIGRIVAGHVGGRIYPSALERAGHTPMHRAGMDKKAREATVKNTFNVQTPRLIAGKNILLVDDVLTSGSTASDCAKALKKNGAVSVTVVTLARAVLYR
jgi:ComF family protein